MFGDLYETLLLTQTIIYCDTLRKVDFLANQPTKWIFRLVMRTAETDQKGRTLIMWFMWWFHSNFSRMALTYGRCHWRSSTTGLRMWRTTLLNRPPETDLSQSG